MGAGTRRDDEVDDLLQRPVGHGRVHQVADGVAVRRAGCRAGAGSELHRVVVERPDGDWRRRLVGVAHARTGSGRWTGLVRADGVRLGGREVLVRLVRPVRDGLSGPRLRGIQPVVGGRRGRPTRAGVRGLGGGRVRLVRVRGNGPGCGPVRLGGRRLRSRPGRRGEPRAAGPAAGGPTWWDAAAGCGYPARYVSYRSAAGCALVCSTWCVPVATVVSADGWADPFGSSGMAGSFEPGDEEQVVILASVGRVRATLR